MAESGSWAWELPALLSHFWDFAVRATASPITFWRSSRWLLLGRCVQMASGDLRVCLGGSLAVTINQRLFEVMP